jgi:class 3 adenylate cyclase/pimeloyl-ACP methyl ester carboxylesterase
VVGDGSRSDYATVFDGTRVAYQVVGDGPVDVLVSRATYFPVDMMWYEPRLVRFLSRMSAFARHVWFDPRGTGASDRIHHEEGRLLESVVDDMVAVLDALGCERAALLGLGVPIPLLFAATHPDRTAALVLADSSARVRYWEDYPIGFPDELVDQHVHDALAGGVTVQDRVAPSQVSDPEFTRWFGRAERLTAPPAERLSRVQGTFATDLREVLSTIQAPSLVINHLDRGRDGKPALQTRYIADHITGARSVEVPGTDYMPFASDSVALIDTIEEFLTGRLPAADFDRVLATVLFTDIVNSTKLAAELGDRRWRELLDRHNDVVRREIDRFRGTRVKSTGDGVLATFDGPARAIRCACAIRDNVETIGLQVRAGLHCGEIELHDGDVAGISVHIGQRVASLATPNQVLVSRTVVDLLAGSELAFHDQGDHQLKGVPGPWRIFEVTNA